MLTRARFTHLLITYTLLALCLRALIPVGYMPDFSGTGQGVLPLMFCDGMDHSADIKMDGMSEADMALMHHHHDHTAAHGLCPFGASALFEFSGVAVPLIAVLVFVVVEAMRFKAWIWQGRTLFSNFSPRSPPVMTA